VNDPGYYREHESAYELSEDLGVESMWEEKNPFVEALKTGLTGAVCGAVVTVVAGFALFGWVTDDTADARMEREALRQVRAVMVDICVAQFEAAPDREIAAEKLRGTSVFARSRAVAHAGWATMPGAAKPDPVVAERCADRLGDIVGAPVRGR